MNFTKLDPSCTIGFYCRTEREFYQFIVEAKEVNYIVHLIMQYSFRVMKIR